MNELIGDIPFAAASLTRELTKLVPRMSERPL
jgi:hypothetical protein